MIVRDGAVLLHQAAGDEVWSLPGGRVEAGESAQDAIVREMREELDTAIQLSRLVWLVENFFEHGGEKLHEVGFYFMAVPAPGSALLTSTGPYLGIERQRGLRFEWIGFSDLASVELRPTVLSRVLARGDFEFRHFVHRADDTSTSVRGADESADEPEVSGG